MLVFVAGIKGQYQGSSDCYEDPKISPLKSSRPRKVPQSKILNPKISFTHPPPPGVGLCIFMGLPRVSTSPDKQQITAATYFAQISRLLFPPKLEAGKYILN